jgi:hypothetical protein
MPIKDDFGSPGMRSLANLGDTRTLVIGYRGAAGEITQVGVALIAEILNADFAGEEAVGGVLPEGSKEFDTGTELRKFVGILAESDKIKDFFLLFRNALEVGLTVALRARGVEPHDSTAQLELKLSILARDEVNELGCTSFDRPAAFLARWDNRLTQRTQRLVLPGQEELGRVAAGKGHFPLRLENPAGFLRRLERDDP